MTIDIATPPVSRFANAPSRVPAVSVASAPKAVPPRDRLVLSVGAPKPAPAAPAPGGTKPGDPPLPGPLPRQAWTVAFNLGTQIDAPEAHFGTAHKLAQVRALADQTRGKRVTIVAQARVMDAASANQDAPPTYHLERYTLRDGRILASETLAAGKTPADDIGGLLKEVARVHPADKLALVAQGHGNGTLGLTVDGSTPQALASSTPAEIAKAVRAGLAAGGRDHLDLLDFDACLMGQAELLERMQGLATTVVASSETEPAFARAGAILVDGQDTSRTVEAVLANPDQDGRALGAALTRAAAAESQQNGAPERPFDPAAPRRERVDMATLESYDMAAFAPFRASLDDLGTQLLAARQTPGAAAAIEHAIQAAPCYDESPASGPNAAQHRDVGAFITSLRAALAQGSLPDPSGKLAAACALVEQRLKPLVDAHFGSKDGGYDKLSGLSLFLPEHAFLDTTLRAQRTGFDDLAYALGHLDAAAPDAAAEVGGMVQAIAFSKRDLPANAAGRAAGAALDKAGADAKTAFARGSGPVKVAALARLREALQGARQASLTPAHIAGLRTMGEHAISLAFERDQSGTPEGGWSQFLGALRQDGQH